MDGKEQLILCEQRAEETDNLITEIGHQISQIQASLISESKKEYIQENSKLKKEIGLLKERLIYLENQNGIKQYLDVKVTSTTNCQPTKDEPRESSPPVSNKTSNAKQKPKDTKPEKKKKEPAKVEEDLVVDVGKLDFRVGKIVSACKHPEADSLYIEQVDVGEDKIRTVVSGLVKFVPLDEMQNRMVVLLCNLKPAKMRGIVSEAMVMCASTPVKVEILIPPDGCNPGDFVEFEGFPRVPDAVLNPKKKIFETCAPELYTNGERVATYKGIPFRVNGKEVVAPTLTNVPIK